MVHPHHFSTDFGTGEGFHPVLIEISMPGVHAEDKTRNGSGKCSPLRSEAPDFIPSPHNHHGVHEEHGGYHSGPFQSGSDVPTRETTMWRNHVVAMGLAKASSVVETTEIRSLSSKVNHHHGIHKEHGGYHSGLFQSGSDVPTRETTMWHNHVVATGPEKASSVVKTAETRPLSSHFNTHNGIHTEHGGYHSGPLQSGREIPTGDTTMWSNHVVATGPSKALSVVETAETRPLSSHFNPHHGIHTEHGGYHSGPFQSGRSPPTGDGTTWSHHVVTMGPAKASSVVEPAEIQPLSSKIDPHHGIHTEHGG